MNDKKRQAKKKFYIAEKNKKIQFRAPKLQLKFRGLYYGHHILFNYGLHWDQECLYYCHHGILQRSSLGIFLMANHTALNDHFDEEA